MSTPEFRKTSIDPRPVSLAKAGRDILEIDAQTYSPPLQGEEWDFAVRKIAGLNDRMMESKDNPKILHEINMHRYYELQVTGNRLDVIQPETGDEKYIKDIYRGSLAKFTDILLAPAIDSGAETDEMERAEEMIEEFSADAADVFGDETYYRLLVRRTHGSAQHYAERRLAPVLRNDLREAVTEFVGELRRANSLIEARIDGIDDGQARMLAESHARDDKDNPHYQKTVVDPFVDNLRRANYVQLGSQVERFWGPDALDSLSDTIKGGIIFYRTEMDGLEG